MKKYNDRNIKEVLDQFVGGHKRIQRGVTNVGLRKVWDDQMGPIISNYTTDLKMYQGVLTIKLSSAPLRYELSMSPEKLIKILNEGMGAEVVKEVRFK